MDMVVSSTLSAIPFNANLHLTVSESKLIEL